MFTQSPPMTTSLYILAVPLRSGQDFRIVSMSVAGLIIGLAASPHGYSIIRTIKAYSAAEPRLRRDKLRDVPTKVGISSQQSENCELNIIMKIST